MLITTLSVLRCPVSMTRKNDQRNSSQINRTGISVILRICPNKLRSSKNKHTCKQSVLTHTEARGVCDSTQWVYDSAGDEAWQQSRWRLTQARGCVRAELPVCVRGVGGVHTELSRRSLGRETRASVGRCPGPTTAYYRCPLDITQLPIVLPWRFNGILLSFQI